MHHSLSPNSHTSSQHLYNQSFIKKLFSKLWPCDHRDTSANPFNSRVPSTMCQERTHSWVR
ncbi:hypothetical protein Hdeb2414_s0012g00381311 [Helianthus debilis subsp. tardiflorus]